MNDKYLPIEYTQYFKEKSSRNFREEKEILKISCLWEEGSSMKPGTHKK